MPVTHLRQPNQQEKDLFVGCLLSYFSCRLIGAAATHLATAAPQNHSLGWEIQHCRPCLSETSLPSSWVKQADHAPLQSGQETAVITQTRDLLPDRCQIRLRCHVQRGRPLISHSAGSPGAPGLGSERGMCTCSLGHTRGQKGKK